MSLRQWPNDAPENNASIDSLYLADALGLAPLVINPFLCDWDRQPDPLFAEALDQMRPKTPPS